MRYQIRSVLTSLTLFAVLPFSAGAAIIYDNGASNPANLGASFSESLNREADDFQLVSNDSVRSVQFWGSHWSSGTLPTVEDFQIVIYADLAGAPNPGVVLGASALSLVSRIDTGFDHNNLLGADILEYTMDLASPISLTAGPIYWLSVYLQTDAPGTFFAWQESGTDGTGNHHLSNNSGAAWFAGPNHLAFNISNTVAAVPEPTTALLFVTGLLGLGVRRRH